MQNFLYLKEELNSYGEFVCKHTTSSKSLEIRMVNS